MRKIIYAFLMCSLVVSLNPALAGETNYPLAQVKAIKLEAQGNTLTWTVEGLSAKGFKVVWSKNPGPSYPLRNGDKYNYYTDATKDRDELTPFAGVGTYYARVCEYLGGRCGVYSNEVKVSLGAAEVVDCTMEYAPVCGVDGRTYSNKCMLDAAGVSKKSYGECASIQPIACTMDYNPVCGVDGRTYSNKCMLDAAGVSKKSYGECVSVQPIACTMDYSPVCGVDGQTYSNKCMLEAAGISKKSYGECPRDEDIIQIEDKADKLSNNRLDDILSELQVLRNQVKEQQNQITHLRQLLIGVSTVTEAMQASINNFITYGVDENTEKIGEGERAAVMYSFKSAFGKLPQNEADLADAIKIANGRWPTQTSASAEAEAKENFRLIYKRAANMEAARDNAAVTIMAYGLRQKAQNRNLESEKKGIQIFRDLFGHLPASTEDWNTMQAITYSGASR